MVSIHNTLAYHNYLNDLKEEPPLSINKNTILEYIFTNYRGLYESVKDNRLITNRLNTSQLAYSLFLRNDTEYNVLDYLVNYKFELNDSNYRLISMNNTEIIVNNSKVNEFNIDEKNIKVGNSIIHLIN
jgi:hypothetical protein